MDKCGAQPQGWNTNQNPTRRDAGSSATSHLSRVFGLPGQDLVEFAIMVPILFLFIFGVIDLSRVFHALNVINNAAREGVRYVSQYGGISKVIVAGGTDYYELVPASVQSVVRNEAGSYGLDLNKGGTSITVTCPTHVPDNRCISGDRVRVVVTYPFDLLTGFVFDGATLTIRRSAEMIFP